MGSPPRRLVLVEGDWDAKSELPEKGWKIFNIAEPPVEVGVITSSMSRKSPEGKFQALAIAKKIHAKEGLAVLCSKGDSDQSTQKGVIAKVAAFALS